MNSLSGCRVLVVEDEVLVAWVLEEMLTELECKVVGPAARVSQALAMVSAEEIDLAILDINLNGQKSYPVADALTAHGVPFAFSTGYNADSMPDNYRGFPMLQKPYSQSDLSATLAKLMALKVPGG
jgi:CheY-like chemotaxis protein